MATPPEFIASPGIRGGPRLILGLQSGQAKYNWRLSQKGLVHKEYAGHY
jgi:hypothetical protein